MEYTESKIIKLSSKIDVELSEKDKLYFIERVICRNAKFTALAYLNGDNSSLKKEINQELKDQIQNEKFDRYVTENNLMWCNIRKVYFSIG